MHLQVALLLALELAGRDSVRARDRGSEGRLQGGVEARRVIRPHVSGLERRHLRGVQDLVGVCVADPGDGRLIAQNALDLRAPLSLQDVGEDRRR